jgi:uncharacterized protein YjiS (DUF1127 family)
MTNTSFTADASGIDALALEQAARRDRDAYIGALLSRGVQALTAAASDWLRRRRTFAELSQLDQRLMADIGLDRAAFAAGVIRRVEDDRAQALATATFATATLAAVAHPATRHAAEQHLAPAATPAAANDSRRAA